jgi:hypothetical protein
MRKRAVKKTVSFQPDVWEYISSQAKDNASTFIYEALCDFRRRRLHESVVQGSEAVASQIQLAEDLTLWDTTLLDGMNDEDDPSR